MAEDNIHVKGSIIRELGKLRKRYTSDSDGVLHWEKDDELIELEQEYKKLKKKKQELKEKAKEVSLLNELQKVIKNIEKAEDHENVPLEKLADNDMLFKALQLAKKRKLVEMYNAYRFTGITCVLLKNDCLRFCLDTCYKGKYFEPYYMEICTKDDNIQILKHTIPFFISIDEIIQSYEGSERLKEFVSVMSTYLNAFIARREQFAEVQLDVNQHYIIKDFYSTAAFDFVKFTIQFSSNATQSIIVKMKYTDLKDKLAKEVDVYLSQNDNEEQANTLKEYLLSMEAKKAIMTSVL